MSPSTALPFFVLLLLGCGGASEPTASSSNAAPTEPAWNVTSGNAKCDEHLKSRCREAALACLSDKACSALVACYRACDASSPDYCAGDCERRHGFGALVDPYVACASTEPACSE